MPATTPALPLDLSLRPGEQPSVACPLCQRATSPQALREARLYPAEAVLAVAAQHPEWRAEDGACPACMQQVLLQLLLQRGDAALHAAVQSVWPLDARAAYGALPTPLRLHADARFAGRGVTVAFVDSAYFPHPDLATPNNRIRAWVDASRAEVQAHRFGPEDTPRWPGWDDAADAQWHGTMTATVACGNGALSRGLFRGLASEASVVLVQVRDAAGTISNASIARALSWLHAHARELQLSVVSLSVAGEPVRPGTHNPVDVQVRALVAANIVVVAAAGNDGQRHLVPPATAPEAITVGGLDDGNTFNHEEVELWHSNYGMTDSGLYKPELVAPSVWVVAPVLPGSGEAAEAEALFSMRFVAGARAPRPDVETAIVQKGLVTPYYKHVEGTSFAAPLVASAVACVLEANRALGPSQVRELLMGTATPVAGAPRERQGAGALEAGRATALALAQKHTRQALLPSARAEGSALVFGLYDEAASRVEVFGSWNGWTTGTAAQPVQAGLWEARVPRPSAPRVAYKFLVDGAQWLDDPANPRKAPDGTGGLNAVLLLGPRP